MIQRNEAKEKVVASRAEENCWWHPVGIQGKYLSTIGSQTRPVCKWLRTFYFLPLRCLIDFTRTRTPLRNGDICAFAGLDQTGTLDSVGP
ncbi:hypothetical protein PTI98_009428 [Pleurotus ostreatus]|nr:hypothetical protein PTI98_009428 [Pleurotus ostreatus]